MLGAIAAIRMLQLILSSSAYVDNSGGRRIDDILYLKDLKAGNLTLGLCMVVALFETCDTSVGFSEATLKMSNLHEL